MLIDFRDLIDLDALKMTSNRYTLPMWTNWSVKTTPISGKTEKQQKVEKRYILPSHLFEAVDFRDMGVVKESTNSIPRFVEGEYYSLQGIACDGFEMKEKVYQLIGVVNEYEGTEINSVIVKQVYGEQDKIFTLSKNDCACLNVEYQSGLQLFPKNLPWKLVKDEVPFDWRNLGTTPLSNIDNTIRHILIRIDGFKDYSDGYVVSPSGKLITEEKFLKTLKIHTIEPIVYGNGYVLKDGKNLNAKVVYPKGLLYNHGNFISSEDTIFVLITLRQDESILPSNQAVEDKKTIDGFFGVEQEYLDNINPNAFFVISWDELSAPTIEEHELEKARKQEEIERRIKEEEERNRRKDEIKKKEKVKKKKDIDSIIDDWVNMGEPLMIKAPRIKRNHTSIDSITKLIDDEDAYLEELNMHFSRFNSTIDTLIKKFNVL